jgi:hypothetical protein
MDQIVEIEEKESELNLQDVILIAREYLIEIKSKWYYCIPFMIAVGCYYAYQHRKEGVKYPAGVTFMVNEEEGSDPTGGSIGALLKSFTGSGGGKESGTGLEKVLQLFKSKSIIEKSLFQKVKVEGKEDFVANHMMNIYGLDKLCSEYDGIISSPSWLQSIRNLKSYSFKSNNIETFNNDEKIMLIVLYEAIAGNASAGITSMILPTLDDKSNIMRFGVTSKSQDLTIALLEGIFAQLSQFYVDQTVEKQSKIFDIVSRKRDSLANVLTDADASLAKFEDSNRNLVWVTGELTKVKLQRRARIAEIMFAEVVKQQEMSDFALRRKTPYVKIIDMARKPLRPVQMSTLRSVQISVGAGILLGAIFIILRKTLITAWRIAKEKIAASTQKIA